MRGADVSLAAKFRERVGMVIPTWFPPTMPLDEVKQFLRLTLADVELFARPERVLLVVDGCPTALPAAHEAAGEVARRTGTHSVVLDAGVNRGKGGAISNGFRRLLEWGDTELLCVRDADNDHSIYDLPALLGVAAKIEQVEQTDNYWVLGRRRSLERPLGFPRGEYERILNVLTCRAVDFALAREGRARVTTYHAAQGPTPDLQSGYKLYTRATAGRLIEGLERADREDPTEPLRWGAEFVPAVELYMRGAILGEASRSTYDVQPQTTFDESDRVDAFGKQIAWLFRRLAIPVQAAQAWLDGVLAATPIRALAGGWEELLALRRYVLEREYPGEGWREKVELPEVI